MIDRQQVMRAFLESCEKTRASMGWTQAQMADALGLTTAVYKKLIAGDVAKIDVYTALRLADLTRRSAASLCGINTPLSDLIGAAAKLPPLALRFLAAVAEFEAQLAGTPEAGRDYVTVMIPTGNLEDGMLWDSCALERVNAARYRALFSDRISCGIRVTSNHLHPVYVSGDVLLIERRPPRDGDTGVFIDRQTGCAYLRRFRQGHPCELIPVNDLGRVFTVDPDSVASMSRWVKFGVVLCKMR